MPELPQGCPGIPRALDGVLHFLGINKYHVSLVFEVCIEKNMYV